MTARARERRAPRLRLRLYIAGESPNSSLARDNLKLAVGHLSSDELTLEIIDVLRDPALGLRDRVLVTPTLVKLAPAPVQRVIGSLRDASVLLAALGLTGSDGGRS